MFRTFIATTIATALLAFSTLASAAPDLDLWAFWNASNESNAQTVDHAQWQGFIDRHVAPSESGINLVAYGDVTQAERKKLNQYIASLTAIDPRTLRRDEQMAYWINLYNALTIEVVLRYPDKKSILRMGERLFAVGPWKDKLVTIAGEEVSLDDIEHRILRPIWRDHRIHYAVNCASLGCPNLATTAFTADKLDALMAQGERDYVNHPRGVGFENGKLTLSSIYDWYGSDFADDEAGLLAHLAERHETLGNALRNYDGRVAYEYDWSPNASSR